VLAPVLRAARLQRQRALLNEHYVEKLRHALPLRQIHLPYMFTSEVGRSAISSLADRLTDQIDAMASGF
jgi:hypothetical protein